MFSEHHAIKTSHLSYSNSTGSQFLAKLLACVTNQPEVSPIHLSELLHLYSPSRSLSGKSVLRLQPQYPWHSHTLAIHAPAPTFGTISQRLCCTLFLQKQTRDISLLQIFQLGNTAPHPYQSVHASCTVTREPLLVCTLCVGCFVKLPITFSISMYITCVIFCLFSVG